jgi:hypothetical protein
MRLASPCLIASLLLCGCAYPRERAPEAERLEGLSREADPLEAAIRQVSGRP